MTRENTFFQTLKDTEFVAKFFSLSLLLVFISSCGNAVQNLEERAKQAAEVAAAAAPRIASISPDYDSIAGGSSVTISGSGLLSVSSVIIGSSCSITSQTDSSITCTVAAGSPGYTDVIISNALNETDTLSNGFIYLAQPTVTAVSPVGGSSAGGDTVTITGTGFYQSTDVTFGGVSCTNIVVVDSTTITCDTPAVAASLVNVAVTNVDAQVGTGTNLYTYKDPATILSITSTSPGDGYYNSGQLIYIIVNYSEAVTTATSTLTLDTGGTASYSSGSGTANVVYLYTPSITEETTDLNVTALTAADAVDYLNVGIDNTLPVAANLADNQAIVLDNTIPTITNVALSSPADGTYASGQIFDIVVTFSEPVITATSSMTLDTAGVGTYFSGSGTTAVTYRYTSAPGENTTDLNINSFTKGDAADLSGNVLSASIPAGSNLADNQAVVIDTTSPSVTSITSSGTADGYYKAGDVITIDVNFDEIVVASTPSLTLDSTGVATYSSGSGTSTLTFSYTVLGGENSSDLNVSSFTVGDTRDGVNNAANATIPGGLNLKDSKNIVVDTTQPTITNITSTTTDGAYGVGGIISIDVTFSEVITSSTSALVLDSAGTATYVSGSGTNVLNYTYTIAATENSADLTVASFTLGDSADLAGNALNTALPGGANLADNKALVVDTAGPTISSINSSTADGIYTVGATIQIDVTFNENVNATTPSLSLDSGGTANYLSGTGTTTLSFTYTVAASENSADLTVSTFNIGDAADALGNLVDPTLPAGNNLADNKALIVDTTAPTITNITSANADGNYVSGNVIQIDVTFSEPVTTTGSDLYLDSTGTAYYLSGTGTTTVSYTYTIIPGEDSGDLNVNSFTISDAVDAAGNVLDGTLPGGANLADNKALVVDTTVPTITNITSTVADGSYGATTVIDVVVTFSESVNTSTSSVTLDTTGTGSYTSGTGSNVIIYTYTVAALENSADLDVTTFNIGDTVDLAGNALDATLPAGANLADNKALVVDTTVPTITNITSTVADGSYGATTAIDVVVTFSETVTTGTSSLTMDTTGTASYTSGSGTNTITYTYTVGVADTSADLNVTTFNIGDAVDAAGNVLDGTLPGGANLADNKALVIDTTVPTITNITSTTANGTYGIGTNIDITLTLSEPLTTSTSALVLDSGGTASYFSGTGTTSVVYRHTVGAGDASADLTVSSVTLGDAVDAAGNVLDGTLPGGANLADNSNIVIDTVQPTISSINSLTANGTYAIGGTINIIVNFSETVNTSTSSLTLDSGGTAAYSSGTGTSTIVYQYTVLAGESSADLNVSSVAIGDAVDTDGNPMDNTLPGGNNLADNKALVIDGIVPTITNITSTTANGTYGAPTAIDVVVTFSEAVTTGTSSLTMDTTGSASYTSGTGTNTITYTYTVAASENSSDLTVSSVTIGDAVDGAGNALSSTLPGGANLADNKALVVDTTAPTILSIAASSADGTYSYGQNVDIVVTYSEAVTTATSTLTLDSGATLANYQSGSGTSSITYRYTVGAGGENSSDLNVTAITVGDAVDGAGNALSSALPAGNNLADNSNIVIYTAPPVITAISPQGGATSGGTSVTITGTGFDATLTDGDIQVGATNCTGVVVVSSTQITCTTGNNAVDGFGDVVITNPDTQADTLVGGFLFTPAISVSSVSQSVGSINGGDTLYITGTNFYTGMPVATSVSIGGVSCSSVTIISATQLSCVTGISVAGTFDIVVSQYYQTATLSSAFTYVDGPAITWNAGGVNPSNPADWGDPGANSMMTFELKNSGTTASSAITISISGANPTYWVLGTDNCTGATLAAGATCTVQVIFLYDFIPSGSYSAQLDAVATSGGATSNGLLGMKP